MIRWARRRAWTANQLPSRTWPRVATSLSSTSAAPPRPTWPTPNQSKLTYAIFEFTFFSDNSVHVVKILGNSWTKARRVFVLSVATVIKMITWEWPMKLSAFRSNHAWINSFICIPTTLQTFSVFIYLLYYEKFWKIVCPILSFLFRVRRK